MNKGEEHLKKLREMAARMKQGEPSDLIVGEQIAEFGALVVTLSETLDKTQRRIFWLTWAVVILTFVLVVLPFIERALVA